MARRLLRLLVPTPDRRRVLARPNGLSGWSLPAVPVDDLDDDAGPWTPAVADAVTRLLGGEVTPVRAVAPDVWEVEPRGRLSRSGVSWVSPADAARLGPDAEAVRVWAAGEGDGG